MTRHVRGLVGGAALALGVGPSAAAGSSVGAWLQQADTAALTLGAAVMEAVATYPASTAARARRSAAAAGVEEAEAARLPRVDLEARATRFEEPMLVSPLHELDPEAANFERTLFRAELAARYLLFNGGAREARIEEARALAGAAGARVDSVVAGLTERTSRTYLDVLGERERVGARAEQVEALAAEVERAREFLEAGRAARVELLRAEAELADVQAEAVSAARGLELAERELARLIGAPVARTRAERVAGPCRARFPFALERERLVARAVAADAAVREARFQTAAAAARLEEARAARWPDVALAGRYIEYGSGGGHFTGEWQAGLEVSYPIFTGGARGARIERAEAEARESAARLDLARLRAAADVDTALALLTEARARVEALAAAVAGFEEVVRVELAALSVGRGTQPDYLLALADLAEARAGLARARADVVAAQVSLARAIGELSPAWIARYVECGP